MKNQTALLAEVMTKSTLSSLDSILRQEGLAKAQDCWQKLNDAYSTEDWWPPVARAKRKLFDSFIQKQQAEEAERQAPAAAATINIVGDVAGKKEWNATAAHVGQIIGVTEGDVIYTKKGV